MRGSGGGGWNLRRRMRMFGQARDKLGFGRAVWDQRGASAWSLPCATSPEELCRTCGCDADYCSNKTAADFIHGQPPGMRSLCLRGLRRGRHMSSSSISGVWRNCAQPLPRLATLGQRKPTSLRSATCANLVISAKKPVSLLLGCAAYSYHEITA